MLGVFWGLVDWETLNLSVCFINGNFVMIKSESIGNAKQTKGRELMPVAGDVVSYPPARGECLAARGALIEESSGGFFALEDYRWVGDWVLSYYDPLDGELREAGIKMVTPHSKNDPKAQDVSRGVTRITRR